MVITRLFLFFSRIYLNRRWFVDGGKIASWAHLNIIWFSLWHLNQHHGCRLETRSHTESSKAAKTTTDTTGWTRLEHLFSRGSNFAFASFQMLQMFKWCRATGGTWPSTLWTCRKDRSPPHSRWTSYNKIYQIYEWTVFVEQIENRQYTQSNCIGNDVSLLYGREQRGQRRRKSNSDTKGSGAMCTGGQDC